jgi:RNA polymerase sigma-70 factor, ECF subfamily
MVLINHRQCTEPSSVFEPIDFDLSELLSKMIRLLPEPQQEVVQLTFFEGMSQRQIAAAKCIALGTVKTRLQLAHKKLLNHLVPIQGKVW